MSSLDLILRRRTIAKQDGGGSILPSGYTAYDWVQADDVTGAPNIDTGLIPNKSLLWTFEGKFARTGALPTNYKATWLFSRSTNTSGYSNYSLGRVSNSSNKIGFNYNSKGANETYLGRPSAVIEIGEWHTFLLQSSPDISYGGEVIIDGDTTTYSGSSPNGDTTTTLKILLKNETTSTPYPCRFAEFKVKYDGELVADFIPAKRDADGVVGFYDVVRKDFYAPTTEGVTLLCGYGFENFTV